MRMLTGVSLITGLLLNYSLIQADEFKLSAVEVPQRNIRTLDGKAILVYENKLCLIKTKSAENTNKEKKQMALMLPATPLLAIKFKRYNETSHHYIATTLYDDKEKVWQALDVVDGQIVLAAKHEKLARWNILTASDPAKTAADHVDGVTKYLAIFQLSGNTNDEGYLVAGSVKLKSPDGKELDIVSCKIGPKKEAVVFKLSSEE